MKKNNWFKIFLWIIFIPFLPIYFVYKSSRINKNNKIILISVYIVILMVVGIIQESKKDVDADKNLVVAPVEKETLKSETKETVNEENKTPEKDNEESKDEAEVEVIVQEPSPEVDDAVEYTNTVSIWAYDFASDFDELSQLLINNDIGSDTWTYNIGEASLDLIDDCGAVIDFKPPTDFVEINTRIVNACTSYMYGVTDLLDGIKNLDEDKISSAQLFFLIGSEHINMATELLNEK